MIIQEGVSTMLNRDNFPAIFERLKTILQALTPPLVVQTDTPDNYYLDAPQSASYPKGLFFGAVQIRKNYVSYHLMPVYTCTDMLEGISEQLRKRMQGKACFNFTTPDETLFTELAQLTAEGFERYRKKQFV